MTLADSVVMRSRSLRLLLVLAIVGAVSLIVVAPRTAQAAPGDSFLAPGGQAGCYISTSPSNGTSTSLGLLSFNYQTNTATLANTGTAPSDVYNAIGYNPVDGYIYGTELRNGVNYVVKIGQNGVVVNNAVMTLPNAVPNGTGVSGYFVGDVSPTGIMYIANGINGTRYVTVNLNTLTSTTGNLAFQPTNLADWVYSNGILYGASSTGNVVAFNAATGAYVSSVSKNGVLPNATGSSPFYGAAMLLQNGQVVFVDNASGKSYMYNPATQTATLVATVPSTAGNDGTCVPSSPSITLTKTGPTQYQVGVPVTYSFTAVNTGNVTMTGIAVSDPLLTAKGISVSCPSSSLAPAASEVCTATAGYVITQADVDAGSVSNTATATGTPPSGTSVTSPPSGTNTPTANQPGISLTKTPSTNKLVAGQTITYTLVATNTGIDTRNGADTHKDTFALNLVTPRTQKVANIFVTWSMSVSRNDPPGIGVSLVNPQQQGTGGRVGDVGVVVRGVGA